MRAWFPVTVSIWISQLKDGDPAAARQLWDIYYGRMVEVARLQAAGSRSRMADEEDVALSAFKSFCTAPATAASRSSSEHEDPWPLLMALTTHKAIDLIRHERRVKRGGPGPASSVASFTRHFPQGRRRFCRSSSATSRTRAWSSEPAEECQHLLDGMSDTLLRAIALWKMEGFTTEEIASKLGCTPRTVERKLHIIRRLWRRTPTMIAPARIGRRDWTT